MQRAIEDVRISEIQVDGGTQARAATRQDVVEEYADELRAADEEAARLRTRARDVFPRVVLFRDRPQRYWLADGFHRLFGHLAAGKRTIRADVYPGTVRDAILYAVGANAQHGLQRSNEDKRHAVGLLLADTEWAAWSDREIARRAGVSDHLVRVVRAGLSAPKSQMRTATRGGTTYTLRLHEPRDLTGEEATARAERNRQEALIEGRNHLRAARIALADLDPPSATLPFVNAALDRIDEEEQGSRRAAA